MWDTRGQKLFHVSSLFSRRRTAPSHSKQDPHPSLVFHTNIYHERCSNLLEPMMLHPRYWRLQANREHALSSSSLWIGPSALGSHLTLHLLHLPPSRQEVPPRRHGSYPREFCLHLHGALGIKSSQHWSLNDAPVQRRALLQEGESSTAGGKWKCIEIKEQAKG